MVYTPETSIIILLTDVRTLNPHITVDMLTRIFDAGDPDIAEGLGLV